jgi:hypothetical protein
MTWSRGERLYHRLPEVYRRRDREQGEPLRALLAVVESQLEALEDDVAGLYENWFVETCQDWVVPYLADLLGVQVLGDPAYAGAQPRTQVARALDYRRHKGTPVVLERVSRDITGWPARAVEMFAFLAHTQNAGHVRPGQGGVFDVRRPEDVAAAGDPFAPPTLFHSVDVRRIASGRGRFNVPDLALHLWRLRSYFIASSPAAPAPETPAGFRFDPLGRDLRLFNRLAPAAGSTRQAAETDLPVPLRIAALDRDLQAWRQRFAAIPQSLRAPASGFYGPGRALLVTNGQSVPAFTPFDVVARNLDAWGAVGRLSGSFASAPSLTAAQPELKVTLGDEGPHVARLRTRPADLAGAAGLLEAALRAADPSPRFANARVFVAGSRLYVVSGEPGDRVAFDVADNDATTLAELHLTSAASAPAPAAISGVLTPFPAILEAAPPLQTGKVALVVVHGSTRTVVRLPAAPRDLKQAQQELAAALQSTTVHVFTAGRRLLLVDENPAVAVSVQSSTDAGAVDPLTAALLDLPFSVAIDPERGRLLLAPGVVPAATGVRVGYAYGFAADLGGGPYDRRSTLTDPATAGTTLTVAKAGPAPALPTLAAAINQWVAGGRLSTVIRIADDELYAESLPAIAVPAGRRLAIEAADGTRPVIHPLSTFTLAGPGAVTLNGLLLDGGLELGAGLDLLLTHSTLVPRPGQASLTFKAGDDPAELRVRVTFSIVGALGLPADLASLELEDSILDASVAGTGGEPLPALVSGPLPGTLALSAHLEVGVKLGSQGPVSARLRQAPTTLAAARDALQAAIRAAGTGTSFSGAQVEVVGSRLLVRSGVTATPPEPVAFSTTTADANTAGALQLLASPAGAAENLAGRLSGDLSVFPALSRPQVGVTIGGDGPWIAVLDSLPVDVGQAARLLQAALRAARDRPAFAAASVESLDDHLLVRPGVAAALVDVAGTPADTYTVADLGFTGPFTPPEGTFVQGVFSALLSPFPSFPGPQLQATLGGVTPPPLNLTGPAATLADVAATLGTALRAASTAPVFAFASVVALGDRLLVRPGTPGAAVSFAGTGQDPRTLGELALAAPPAEVVDGLLSSNLASFPSFLPPQLQVTLGGEGPRLAVLAGVPMNAGSARELLQAALRAASTSDVFRNAEVLQLGARLLVRSGGAAVVVQAAPADANTAVDLGLIVPPARQLQGLLSGPVAPFPTFPVAQLKLAFGGAAAQTATLAGFPTTSQDARSQLETAIQAAGTTPSYTGARVGLSQGADGHDHLLVISGVAGETVRADGAADDPLTVADLGLAAPGPLTPGAVLVSGLLSGDLFPFPILFRPQVAVTFGALGPTTAVLGGVPASLAEAATLLTAALKAASTNPRFANAGVLVGGDRLLIQPGPGGQPATFAPTAADPNTAESLALVQPPARSVQGLLSGDLATFPVFSRARLQIAIGASGPLPAELASFPANLTAAAAALQSAIRAASASPAFTAATVTAYNGRLLIQPGTSSSGPVTVTAAPAPDSATAGDLALLQPPAAPVLVSGDLAAFPALQLPQVAVTLGTHGPFTATLTDLPASLDSARSLLEAAIQAANSSSTFMNARVVKTSDDRLLVFPGVATDAVAIANSGTDATATELKLTAGPGNAANGLFSGSLATFPTLTSPVKVDATFGTTTRTATLSGVPTDLATARSLLETALRATTPAVATFTGARVLLMGSQLLVLPGVETDAASFALSTGSTAATDLELTAAAGASRALLSGTLNPLPALTVAPALTVTLAGNSRPAVLTSVPKTLAAAAAALQTAIRAADPSALFTGATVDMLDTRLLVRPGGAGGSLLIADAGGGHPNTATALLLKAGSAATALLSGDLSTFGGLSITPQVQVTIGATGPSTLRLARVPAGLDDARALLQSALQSGTGPAFTGATVELFGTRLLVIPGAPGGGVTFADTPVGPPVATLLALIAGVATSVDGLLSGTIASPLKITLPPLALAATIGAVTRTVDLGQVPGQLGQVPANLADLAGKLQALLRAPGGGPSFDQAQVLVMGNQILVLPGVANDPVAFTPALASPQVVTTLQLDAGAARTTRGLLSTALSAPLVLHIAPSLNATFGSDGPHELRFTAAPKSLQAAAVLLQSALRAAATTTTFTNAVVQVLGNRLVVTPGTATDAVTFAVGSSGPPAMSMLGLSPDVAAAATGLLSGPLPVVPLEAASPEVQATLGGTTATARFTTVPVDLATARSGLEKALRSASLAATFTGAQVDVVDGSSLLVRPGVVTDGVAFAGTVADPDTAGQLRLTAGRARSARGLLSGSLTPLPALTPGGSGPRVDVTLGAEGPRTATLAGVPASLGEARDFLETAIQSAQTTPAFTGARVLLVGDRLLVLPGTAGVAVTVANVSGGPSTATELKLTTAMGAVTTEGLLSGDGFVTPALRLDATLAGLPGRLTLGAIPADLGQARDLLERALRVAAPDPPFRDATVRLLGDRLLVRPGGPGSARLSFSNAPFGPAAATLLGLAPGERGDGLLSGPLPGFAGLTIARLAVEVTFGDQGPYAAQLTRVPATLADLAPLLQSALRAAATTDTFTGARVQTVGQRLLITPGRATDGVAFAPVPGRHEDFKRLGLDRLVPAGGLLSAALPSTLDVRSRSRLAVQLGSDGPRVIVLSHPPADLEDAANLLQQALRAAPGGGGGFQNATVRVVAASRLLVGAPGVTGDQIVIGPVSGTPADPNTVFRLRLDTGSSLRADGLLSGDLPVLPPFSLRPIVDVTIGDEEAFHAELPFVPATPAEAREALETALHAARSSPAFTLSRVALSDDQRLIVLPGSAGRVTVAADPGDARTAGELKLTDALALHVGGLLSGPLAPTLSLRSSAPELRVVFSTGNPVVVSLGTARKLADVRAALQAALAGRAFVVLARGDRLAIVPAADGVSVGVSTTANDATTAGELGLAVGRAVGTGTTDEEAGPPLSLTRATVFGRVIVRELPLASEVIFDAPVRVERRQAGCVRFCYLPAGSEAPRGFRCQPDLALAQAMSRAVEDHARELGLTSADELPAAVADAFAASARTAVLTRLQPRFTSERYGDPGYGQLTLATATEILTGAENGLEMGAFHQLLEPLRRRQLATLIAEYLRFGLDAGTFDVT